MPIYEYVCSNCGFSEEVMYVKREDREDIRQCCCCNDMSMMVVPSTASFDLRGPGFHKNDYD